MKPALRRWGRGAALAALLVGLGAAAMAWYAHPMTSFLLADAWLLCAGLK